MAEKRIGHPALISVWVVCLMSWPMPAMSDGPLSGVASGFSDLSNNDHADSMEENPAGPGFGEEFQLSYTYTNSAGQRTRAGHGLWSTLRFFDTFTTGFGVQWLHPDGLAVSLQDTDNEAGSPSNSSPWPRKWTWSNALTLSPELAIGLSWHTVRGATPFDHVDAYDVGLQYRPSRWLSLGITNADAGDSELLDRRWGFGLGLRPWGEAFTVSGYAEITEGANSRALGTRMQWNVYKGMGVGARFDVIDNGEAETQRLMVGITDFGAFETGFFYHAPNVKAADGREGISVSARLRPRPEETYSRPHRPLVTEVVIEDLSEFRIDGFFSPEADAPFLRTLQTLRKLSADPEVEAVLLHFRSNEMGWAQASELRREIRNLQAAKKKVFAWFAFADTRTFTVISAADKSFVAPAGGVLLTGLEAQSIHIAELLERFGIRAEFVNTGPYKTAPETFTRRAPSPAADQVQNALLDDLFDKVVDGIAESKGLDAKAVKDLIDEGTYTAQLAVKAGLVDDAIHYDQLEQFFEDQMGGRVRFRSAQKQTDLRNERWGSTPKVAVLYVTGPIIDGASINAPFFGSASTGSGTLVPLIEDVRRDADVAAVVLRIDSPGGSVTASDDIWRALVRLNETKPLVVSMGDVAASGGYYVAAPGRLILASPETITGSIGVFAGKFDLSGLYAGLGVNRRLYTRGNKAGLLGDSRPWTDAERASVQASVNALYDLFLQRVAAGREHLDAKAVHALARGRVWSGAQAKSCGLVDAEEGLLTAIEQAAAFAGLGDGEYETDVPTPPGGFDSLLPSLIARISLQNPEREEVRVWLNRLWPFASHPFFLFDAGAALALMPFTVPPKK